MWSVPAGQVALQAVCCLQTSLELKPICAGSHSTWGHCCKGPSLITGTVARPLHRAHQPQQDAHRDGRMP